MKKFLFLLSLLSCLKTHAELNNTQINKIVDAIRRVENSKRFPYGIRSIPIKGNNQKEREIYARKVCFQSVKNNYLRWSSVGKQDEFIIFMARRFCPISDPLDTKGLNYNWAKNLKSKLDFVIK